jgi:DNA replication protein DnaC
VTALRQCALGERPWPLLIAGPAGVGKTCAALLLCDRTWWSAYFTLADLCTDVLSAMRGELEIQGTHASCKLTIKDLWDRIGNGAMELVVCDEVGRRGRASDHETDVLHNLLEARAGFGLILISNQDPADLAEVYSRQVASRISAGTVLWVQGPDRRPSDDPADG